MAFEATKREWGELYAFFRLLADGYVYSGTPDVRKNEALRLPARHLPISFSRTAAWRKVLRKKTSMVIWNVKMECTILN
jgi:hypothetical protein